MNITPAPPTAQLLLTTLYIYFVENWDALKIKIIKKNPIVIYDNRLFEKKLIKVPKIKF